MKEKEEIGWNRKSVDLMTLLKGIHSYKVMICKRKAKSRFKRKMANASRRINYARQR